MKTTLNLPDDLLMEAKTLAVRRKTTLKALVESALRREIRPAAEIANPDPEKFEVGPLGFLVLKRKPGETITLKMVQAIEDQIDDEEFQRAIHPPQA
jgi:predicted transcriptional regulator